MSHFDLVPACRLQALYLQTIAPNSARWNKTQRNILPQHIIQEAQIRHPRVSTCFDTIRYYTYHKEEIVSISKVVECAPTSHVCLCELFFLS